ncbi:MAG: HAMP domain-containing histidine kinase, partial [Clostridiales bacterium]|nr:HAMP domain-containing histidine kinase [Clostridiales bacterium]
MKLWKKVSIISIIILVLVITVCSGLLLKYAKDNILRLTVDNAKVEQRNLSTSFTEMIGYYIQDEIDPAVQTSVSKYCFSRFASDRSILVYNGETLYSSVAIEPQTVLPIVSGYGQQVFLDAVADWNVLIIGSEVPIFSGEYSIYVVKDVTGIYNNIDSMFWRFALICAIGIIIGTILIMLLVNKTLKPLRNLKNTTRHISMGEYKERVDIVSKDEVGELAFDFNIMADAIEEHIHRLKDTTERQQLFIDGLTHEFKTPMTSMLIHTDTLLNANLDEKDKETSLLHIYQQCRWLEELTQKLLNLITLKEKIHTSPESIEDLFLDICRSIEKPFLERGIKLESSCHIEKLNMDYDLMKSLIINLVDNASKASNRGQTVFLKAYENTIEVTDQGIGIPEDEIDRIMDPFYMIDRSRSKEKG